MSQLRHLVIATQDPAKALEFYTKVFGFKELKYIHWKCLPNIFLQISTHLIIRPKMMKKKDAASYLHIFFA